MPGADVNAPIAEPERANPFPTTGSKWSVLQKSSKESNISVEVIENLLSPQEKTAGPEQVPLSLAAQAGHLDKVHTLIEAGAEVNVVLRANYSVLLYAVYNLDEDEPQPPMVDMLMCRGRPRPGVRLRRIAVECGLSPWQFRGGAPADRPGGKPNTVGLDDSDEGGRIGLYP